MQRMMEQQSVFSNAMNRITGSRYTVLSVFIAPVGTVKNQLSIISTNEVAGLLFWAMMKDVTGSRYVLPALVIMPSGITKLNGSNQFFRPVFKSITGCRYAIRQRLLVHYSIPMFYFFYLFVIASRMASLLSLFPG